MRHAQPGPAAPQRRGFTFMQKLLTALGIGLGLGVSAWGFAQLPGVYRHMTYEVAQGRITEIVDGCLYWVKVTGFRSTILDASGLIPCEEAERRAAEKEGKAVAQVVKVRAVGVTYRQPDGRNVAAVLPIRLSGGYDLVVGGRVQLQYHPDTPNVAERRMANPFALSCQGQYGIATPPPPETARVQQDAPPPKLEPGSTRYYVFATITAILFALVIIGVPYLVWRVYRWLRGGNRTPLGTPPSVGGPSRGPPARPGAGPARAYGNGQFGRR